MFSINSEPLDSSALVKTLNNVAAGGCVTFEGWVRDENEGKAVHALEYEAYSAVAEKEGAKIIEEAKAKFGLLGAACAHRVGLLDLGDMAVWVGVSSGHRAAAFDACRYIIDEVKLRLPIWKKEHYTGGDSGWVNCEACQQHPADAG